VRKTIAIRVLALLLLAVGIGGMGCEEDDADYYTALDSADQTYDERADATGDISNEAEAEEEFVDAFRDLVADVSDLDPPSEAAEPHGELVSALEQFAELVQKYEGVDPRTTNQTDFERTLALADEITAACQELERAASQQGKSIDLFCAEDDAQ
jgi:hypothetical protein